MSGYVLVDVAGGVLARTDDSIADQDGVLTFTMLRAGETSRVEVEGYPGEAVWQVPAAWLEPGQTFVLRVGWFASPP